MMNILSLKHIIASTVLVGALFSHSASALLINSSAEQTGTEGVNVSFGGASVGVGYIKRWTTRECKRILFIKKCKTKHHQSDEIQINSLSYTWNFGDGDSSSGSVSTGRSYFKDGDDNLLIHVPAPQHAYFEQGLYEASLTVKASGNSDTRNTMVMVRPSEIISSTANVCDSTKATAISTRTRGKWTGKWRDQNGFLKTVQDTDIVLIKKGHTVQLPEGNQQRIQVAGLCIEGSLATARNKNANASNHVVLTANVIRNKGTIETSNGVTGSIIGNNYYNATDAGTISIFAGRFINDGIIDAKRGGDDEPYSYYETGSGVINAWGGDGGHIGIFPNEFINSGSLSAGAGGDATLFKSWSQFVYGNAYAGHGGAVHISARNLNESESSGNLTAGCGGSAEAVGGWKQTVKVKQAGFLTSASFTGNYSGKLFDVAGGHGGNLSINLSHLGGAAAGCEGQTYNHTEVYPTEYIRYEPTILTVDETTRLTNANTIYIYAGDDAEVDLRRLAPNAVQAHKNIVLSVGENSTIDLRGVSNKVFQAAEKVEVYADNILLDDGVTMEDLADAPEVTVSPSKILYFADLHYQAQAKSQASSVLPVQVTILNNGPKADTYTIAAQDGKSWLSPTYPTEINVNGLRRSDVIFNLGLPGLTNEQSELTVTVTSQSDPTVKKQAIIRVGVEQPEIITPRDGRKADVSIVLDAHYLIEDKLDDVADSLTKLLIARGSISPTDSELEDWLNQFTEENPPTKNAYLEFIQQFQPEEPPTLPIIELITFANNVATTRVVTDNLGEVIGRIRALQTSESDTCDSNSVEAVEYAATNLKEGAHLFLATATNPTKDMDAVIQTLQQNLIKTHVLLAKPCDESSNSALAYQELSEETGGFFLVTTQDRESDLAILDHVLNMTVSTGKFSASGAIFDEQGNPLVGAKVEAGGIITKTDENGEWFITGLPEEEHTLKVNMNGYVFEPIKFITSHNSPEVTIAVPAPRSALDVTIERLPNIVEQGEPLLTYSTVISNKGHTTATGIQLTQTLSTGHADVHVETQGGTCSYDGTANISCQLNNLPVGQNWVVDTHTLPTQTGTLTTHANLTSQQYPEEDDTLQTRVYPYFRAVTWASPSPTLLNGNFVYTMRVINGKYSTAIAEDAVVKLQLPNGVSFISANLGELGNCGHNAGLVTCNLNPIPENSTATFYITAKATHTGTQQHTAETTAKHFDSVTSTGKVTVINPVTTFDSADIMFLVDTTGSMDNDIQAVIEALTQLTDELDNNGKQAPKVGVILFKDEVTDTIVTDNLESVIRLLQNIKVSGGNDKYFCPENTVSAMIQAVSLVNNNGRIILVTDASAHPDTDADESLTVMKTKNVKFDGFLTGDCVTGNLSGQLTRRRTRSDEALQCDSTLASEVASAKQVYGCMAEQTDGILVDAEGVKTGDIGAIDEYVTHMMGALQEVVEQVNPEPIETPEDTSINTGTDNKNVKDDGKGSDDGNEEGFEPTNPETGVFLPPPLADAYWIFVGSPNGHIVSQPAGIDCNKGEGQCFYYFKRGTQLKLIPQAPAGLYFDSWTGDLGCEDGEFTVTGTKGCGAIFYGIRGYQQP
ncbi:VWA domain-containing protein [Candidatus Albibeggiatoa sp. nov. BB20]|uniref:VWA domain-containing protein n=1 Tax=Candidatus Albibeggiatoa sp. nov. BB20 TaxID=3162723 RepID=UPI0033659BCA